MRRESVSQNEQTYIRLRQEMNDMNNQNIQRTADKLDRLRDELEYKSKENEKVFKYSLFFVLSREIHIYLRSNVNLLSNYLTESST